MRVEAIWQHPVKSMIGQSVESGDLTPDGLAGDRAWAVRDEVRGGIRGAKKIGGLMRFAARYVDDVGGEVEITLPDGSTVRSSDADVNRRVSDALQHEITLWPLMPRDQLEHYRRGPRDNDDVWAEMRAIFGREDSEPLPDFRKFPEVVVEFESPPGTYLDCYPLVLQTTASFKALAQALPDSVVDVRRFRPNLIIDTGDEVGHPELGWSGRRLRIGAAEIAIVNEVPRCVMVTREIDATVPEDRAVLRHIVKDLDQNVGAYAAVEVPGRIAVGDPVEFC